MIITEQNNKNSNTNEELGATQTFNVTSNSAEALKNKINQANEQSLARRSNAARPRNTVPRQSASRPTAARPTSDRQTADRSTEIRQMADHSVQNRQTARPSQPMNRQPEQTAARQNPVMTTAGTAQNRAIAEQRQQVQQLSQPSQQMPQPVRRPTQTQQTAQPQTVRTVQQNTARNVSSQAVKQTSPANVPVKKASPKNVRDDSLVKKSMMQTKQNSTAGITKTAAVKDKYDDYGGSDEGGNTVVSVLKAVIYIIFVIVISVFLAFGMITVGNDVFAFVKSDEVVELTIPEYATIDDVAEVLFMNDVIKYPEVFKLYAAIKEDNGEFLAGTYSVSPMTNYDDLLDAFKEQPVTGIVRITIPEGSTTDEIIDIFLAKGIGTREGFIDVIENYEFDYWFVKELEEKGTHEGRIYRLDGYLFPDTYDFYLNSSEYTVINKLLKRFTQIFTKEYREQCAAFGYTVDEMITLASIIEKEAGAPSEFFTVSSVFHNRLNAPWSFPKLESDATIVYVLSHEKGERTAITAADLQYDTPYNTYLYNGFPPGPISNPSASAMLAALSPTETSYYFFIANKGKTYFSETKDEHNAYIAQFRAEAQAADTTP